MSTSLSGRHYTISFKYGGAILKDTDKSPMHPSVIRGVRGFKSRSHDEKSSTLEKHNMARKTKTDDETTEPTETPSRVTVNMNKDLWAAAVEVSGARYGDTSNDVMRNLLAKAGRKA